MLPLTGVASLQAFILGHRLRQIAHTEFLSFMQRSYCVHVLSLATPISLNNNSGKMIFVEKNHLDR